MSSSTRRQVPHVAFVLIIAAVAAAAIPRPLLAQDATRPSDSVIGTYDAQRVFERSGYSEQLGDEIDLLYEQMHTAQEAGDRTKLLELQRTLERVRRETINDFNEAVQEALPGIAQSLNLTVVAGQYDYLAEGITPQVLDDALVAAMKTLIASAAR